MMNKKQINVVASFDDKRYKLASNQEFLKYYNNLIVDGYYPILESLEGYQQFIDRVVSLYEFKYPDVMFYDGDKEQKNKISEIISLLDYNHLRYRLGHDNCQFLDCSYGGILTLYKKSIILLLNVVG